MLLFPYTNADQENRGKGEMPERSVPAAPMALRGQGRAPDKSDDRDRHRRDRHGPMEAFKEVEHASESLVHDKTVRQLATTRHTCPALEGSLSGSSLRTDAPGRRYVLGAAPVVRSPRLSGRKRMTATVTRPATTTRMSAMPRSAS